MKWLSILWQFIIRHLPRFLRWSADHVEDVVDPCDSCCASWQSERDDCPYKEEGE